MPIRGRYAKRPVALGKLTFEELGEKANACVRKVEELAGEAILHAKNAGDALRKMKGEKGWGHFLQRQTHFPGDDNYTSLFIDEGFEGV